MNQPITRREMLASMARLGAGALAIPALAPLLAAAEQAGAPRPNILYIMADDHASQALSCYGSRINKTPNLDKLAAGGMRFDNCFCTNGICGPSRATLLTGNYSHVHGFKKNGDRFDPAKQTFPKLLQQAGYQTAIVGKWHLTSNPTGFDYWEILPGQGRYYNPELIRMGKQRVHKGYVTDVITDLSIDYIKNRDKSGPFCLLCHHNAPHRSWEPDEKYAHLYDDADILLPATYFDDYANRAKPAKEQEMRVAELGKDDLKVDPPAGLAGRDLAIWKYQRFIKDYLRCVASLDENVGRVLDYLDQSGLANNTLVVYTSDNGFFLGDHGWFDKRFMYEQGLRIPLLMRWPGRIAPASSTKDFAINADFAPTFLDGAGVKPALEMQGKSLLPILAGQTPADWRKSTYYHYYEFPQPHHVSPHYGVRTERYKLMCFYTIGEWELFDLQADPDELKSVYDDPAYALVREQMKEELARVRAQFNDAD